jgi:predicted O-methyltransferase YrrM
MMDATPPAALAAIMRDTTALGFALSSDAPTGALLRALAASKPGGHLLELGTGTGHGTAWLLDGMDAAARLTTVDLEAANVDVARRHLGHDPRVTFHVDDGVKFLAGATGPFDLIFADAMPGKYDARDRALDLLAPGGLYVVDDLLPKADFPEGLVLVPQLMAALAARDDLVLAPLPCASGLLVATRVPFGTRDATR